MCIRWQDKIFNKKVSEQSYVPGTVAMIIIEQLHWAGHTSRIEDTGILQQLLCCGLEEAACNQDRQMNHFKDILKFNFK